MRILLIPLFFKQIKASRGMQLVQPEMQALQKKYKGKTDPPASREAMSREMMELYRKHGTNPFASCLPILLQSPIFFALFRVLYELPSLASGTYARAESIGPPSPASWPARPSRPPSGGAHRCPAPSCSGTATGTSASSPSSSSSRCR